MYIYKINILYINVSLLRGFILFNCVFMNMLLMVSAGCSQGFWLLW